LAIVLALNGFIPDMGVVTPQPHNLLLQSGAGLTHQVVVAAVPQLIPMGECPGHTVTHGLDRILTDHLGIEWRQFLPPIDDFRIIAGISQ
jgi:hypothetical protein